MRGEFMRGIYAFLLLSVMVFISCSQDKEKSQPQKPPTFSLQEVANTEGYFWGMIENFSVYSHKMLMVKVGNTQVKGEITKRVQLMDLQKSTTLEPELKLRQQYISMSHITKEDYVLAGGAGTGDTKALMINTFHHAKAQESITLLQYGRDPEPIYDPQGEVLEYQNGNSQNFNLFLFDKKFSPVKLKLSHDGTVYVLACNDKGSLYLFVLDPLFSGTKVRKLIMPTVQGRTASRWYEPGLIDVSDKGDIYIAMEMTSEEIPAFEKTHNTKLNWTVEPVEGKVSYGSVLIKLNPSGEVVEAYTIPAKNSNFLSDLSVRGSVAALTGVSKGQDRDRIFVYRVDSSQKVSPTFYQELQLSDKEDESSAIQIRPDQTILLGGEMGYQQVATGSVVEPGQAYLAVLDSDLSIKSIETYGGPRRDSVGEIFTDEQDQIYVTFHFDFPLTHDSEESWTGRSVVYKILETK